MAITFPRALPSFIGAVQSRFELADIVSTTRTLSGAVIATQFGESFWRFSVSTPALSHAEAAQLQAWWESLRGGLKTFLAHDFRMPELQSYPTGVTALTRSGGGAFDGTCRLAALTATSLTLGATGGLLPSGLQFKAGDKVGLVSAGATPRYFVHRVLEDAAATAGGVATLSVGPTVFTSLFAVGDTVRVSKPVCEFVPDKDSWNYDPGLVESGISFAGVSRVM